MTPATKPKSLADAIRDVAAAIEADDASPMSRQYFKQAKWARMLIASLSRAEAADALESAARFARNLTERVFEMKSLSSDLRNNAREANERLSAALRRYREAK